jgi:uncharacterized membrane protein
MTWPFWFLLTGSNVIYYFAQQLLIKAVLLSLLNSYPPTERQCASLRILMQEGAT